MSWSRIDEWRERQAEERREQAEYLMGKPCINCDYRNKCDYCYNFENCEIAYFDEYEETWVVDCL